MLGPYLSVLGSPTWYGLVSLSLTRLWSMWSDWLVVCDTGFSLSALWCPLSVPTVLLGSLPTRQEKTLHMDITRWPTTKSDWLYSLQTKMEKLYTVSKNKTGSWLWLRSWTPYCQIQTKLKKVGKTNRPFRYDINQIPYDYTIEVRNKIQGTRSDRQSTWWTMA